MTMRMPPTSRSILRPSHRHHRRGISLPEMLTACACLLAVLALLTPLYGSAQNDFSEAVSANNLRVIGAAHVTYANDWDGRQWTMTPDDLTLRIDGYRDSYSPDVVPPAILGFDCEGEYHESGHHWFVVQSWHRSNCSMGNFRFWNTNQFNRYFSGRVYDRTFWAPRQLQFQDKVHEELNRLINTPCQWIDDEPYYSPTYCMSLAAQVDPEVYRGRRDGGSQAALDLDFGHRTPNLGSARYPDLKSHMLEHYWLNNWPEGHDPYIPNTGGVPWYFNMSDLSEPITLFFDGSVRKLPVFDALRSNDTVVRAGGDPLWADDEACFGSGGYFENYSQPPHRLEVRSFIDKTTSFHVFTRDGILGRDTLFTK